MVSLKDHPIEEMLFFVADEVDEGSAAAMRQLVQRLAQSRAWTIDPPIFVDEVEDPEDPQDEPLRTVGGVLRLYSGRGHWADKLPVDVDRKHLEEVRAVIDALRSFSAMTGHELELELNGVHLGTIADGSPDRLISEGFLLAWEQTLRSKAG